VVLVAAVTVLGGFTIIPLPVGPILGVAGALALVNLGYVLRNHLLPRARSAPRSASSSWRWSATWCC